MRDEIDEFGLPGRAATQKLAEPEPHDGGLFNPATPLDRAAVAPSPPAAATLSPHRRVRAATPTTRRSAGRKVGVTRLDPARGAPARDLPADHCLSPKGRLPADPLRPADNLLSSNDRMPGEPHESGLSPGVTRGDAAALDRPAGGHHRGDTRFGAAVGGTCDNIRELWRHRQSWHRAEKSPTLQCKAVCRRVVYADRPGMTKTQMQAATEALYRSALGDMAHPRAVYVRPIMEPLLVARDGIQKQRLAVEKHIAKLGALTPLAGFVAATHGVGMLSLSGVIGEAGDLSLYANPAKLWKRMGLAVMPDGQRQRRVAGVAALDHGYSPQRRSLVWTIGDCFVKAGGPYRAVYDARKVYETGRLDAEGEPLRPIVCHLRAKRYAEKRLLRDLWRHWRASLAQPALDVAA